MPPESEIIAEPRKTYVNILCEVENLYRMILPIPQLGSVGDGQLGPKRIYLCLDLIGLYTSICVAPMSCTNP